MVGVVKGMDSAMKSMDVEKVRRTVLRAILQRVCSSEPPFHFLQIARTMDQFEKQFEDMDVRSAYMEDAINTSTSMTTPPEQVDELIQVRFFEVLSPCFCL